MTVNYRPEDYRISYRVFSIKDATEFLASSNWRKQASYYFTGLKYRMLVCPHLLAADELLLTRPGLYFKSDFPYGGVVYFEEDDPNNLTDQLYDEMLWIVESYLFKLNSSLKLRTYQSGPRFYVDYSNSIPFHGDNVFDKSRCRATEYARNEIDKIHHEYERRLLEFVKKHPYDIGVSNYTQTSILEEVCTHTQFLAESVRVFIKAIKYNRPETLNNSTLTGSFEHINCSKEYNRVLLSFYLTAIKEPCWNSHGSYISMFTNFYNILEYFMDERMNQGKQGKKNSVPTELEMLENVLDVRVGIDQLSKIIQSLKSAADKNDPLVSILTFGDKLSNGDCLEPIHETDTDLISKIAKRLYKKRCGAVHSKKTRKNVQQHNTNPGPTERHYLDTELAIIRPIAEFLVKEADPNE